MKVIKSLLGNSVRIFRRRTLAKDPFLVYLNMERPGGEVDATPETDLVPAYLASYVSS